MLIRRALGQLIRLLPCDHEIFCSSRKKQRTSCTKCVVWLCRLDNEAIQPFSNTCVKRKLNKYWVRPSWTLHVMSYILLTLTISINSHPNLHLITTSYRITILHKSYFIIYILMTKMSLNSNHDNRTILTFHLNYSNCTKNIA